MEEWKSVAHAHKYYYRNQNQTLFTDIIDLSVEQAFVPAAAAAS